MIVMTLIRESHAAHAAIRHALQHLRELANSPHKLTSAKRLPQCIADCEKVIDTDGDFQVFTREESKIMAGIVANYINEQGSIMNDYDLITRENELRAKLELPLIKGESEMSDEELAAWHANGRINCTCAPMPQGTNPNCRRHGLREQK